MNTIVQTLNTAGRAFVGAAAPMLIQSSLLILILLAVDALLRKRVRAVFRYWIWMLVLVKLVLPPSLWSPVSVGTWFGDTLEVPAAALLEPLEHVSRASSPRFEGGTPSTQQGQDALATKLSPAVASFLSPPQPMTVVPSLPEPCGPAVLGWGPITPEGGGATRSVTHPPALSLNWQGFVLLVWAATVVALLLLLVQRTFFVWALVAQAQEAGGVLVRELDGCRQQLSLRRPVAVRLSANAASPAVCGLWRPVILIPHNLASRLHGAGLQAVLFHELAHIKRGDLWINLLQTILQILYFYNPLLWLANTLIRRIREKAVDETVLVALGEAAPQYPDALIHVAKLALARRPALSLRLLGVVESKSALTSRIQHILNRPFPKTARLGLLGLLVVSVLAAVLLPMAKGQWLLEPGNTVGAGEEADPSRSRFPDLALAASYRDLPGVFLREYRLARRVVEDAEGNLTGSRLVESHGAFEALSRMSDAFPVSLYAQRWVIILDWLAGGTDAVGAAERMRALAEAQSHVAESNLTRAYAAVILARDGHLDRAHDTFVGCSPSETPQWGWFVFEMNKYLNRRIEACAPNVDRMVDGKTVQTARTREQWQAIETELRAAQTAYADYLEYELLPLAAVAITSQKTRQYGELECLQIVDALRSLLVGQAHCFSLGATTHAIETRFQQRIAPKILAAWYHSLPLYDEERQGGETAGHVQEIKARWTQLNLPWDSLPAWWQRIQSDAHGAPSNTKAKWVESRRIRKAEAQGPVLTSKHMTLRDRMPLKKLRAHKYYRLGEPIWVYLQSTAGSSWKPNLDEIDHDPDDSPWIFLIDGEEYGCRQGFGPFDSVGGALEIFDNLYFRPGDFRLPVGKHTVAYGWKNVDVVDPNDPGHPIHFARLATDPAEFEVVEQLPADYYQPVYQEGWEDILRRRIETPFTDDMHKYGVADPLLALRVDRLPFDTAFGIYVQAEGSEEQHSVGELALAAGSFPYIMGCDRGVKELNWDTVGDKRWRIILRPSVDVAKKRPPIHEFYAREFVTDWLSFERSSEFERNRLSSAPLPDVGPHYAGTIKADRPVDLDVLGRRWGGRGETWPLPAGFELGWSPDNGGTLRIDPNSGVRLLRLPEANARLARVAAQTRQRLVELPQSRTTQVVPPKGEPTLMAVLSSEGKVYFVTVSKVNETWANLDWFEDREATRRGATVALNSPEPKTVPSSQTLARLPSGVTVELLGACDFPSEGKQWWRPDGAPLAEAPYDRRSAWVTPSSRDKAPFELALRVRNLPENWEAAISTPDNAWSNAADPPRKAGRRLPELRWLMMEAEPNQTTCTIRCNLAAPWQTVARSSLPLAPSQPTPGDGVVFSEVREGFGGGRVTVSGRDSSAEGVSVTVTGRVGGRDDSWLFSVGDLRRIVAITKDGKMQKAPSDGLYLPQGVGRAIAYFPQLSLAGVREFQFQTRPLTWVEFRNVPLRRDLKTDVQVDVRSADTSDNAALPSGTQREREIVLPEADRQPVILDLAAGELVPLPPVGPEPEKVQQALRKLGKGDLVFDCDLGDRTLILLRDATSEQAQEETGEPSIKGHFIGRRLPEVLTVETAEGRRYRITILAADDKACTLKYSPVSAGKGAGGGVLVEPDKAAAPLELRIAPRRGELGPDAVEEFTKALAEGRSLADSRCLWVPVRADMNLSADLVTQVHQGKTWLLVYNDASLIMVPSQSWRLVHVGRDTDETGRPMLVLRFDETGATQMVRLTRSHGDQLLAIVVGGIVVSTPTIPPRQEGIRCATIIGAFTEQALAEMTTTLRRSIAGVSAGTGGDFRPIKLRNGVTVELLGVCKHPSVGRQWWRPDGSPLAERPYDDDEGRAFPKPGEKGYKLAIRFSGLAGKDVGAYAIPSDAQSTNGGTLDQISTTNRRKNADYLDGALDRDVVWQGVAFDQELDSFDLRVGVSRGPWKNEYGQHIGKSSETVEWAIFKDVTLRPQRRVEADKGAGGGALAAPGKDGTILAFRIAPTPEEVGAELVEQYKQALTGGGRPPDGTFVWFEVRPGTTGAPYQITREHDGKTYVLLWNDESHVMRADGTWGLEEVRETTDGMGRPSVVLTFDATGVRLFHALGDANLRHSLAVVFEGRVIAIPFISTTLSGPSLPIIGRFTAEEIKQMVATLRRVTAASTPGISGRVVDPDGKPVAGAQVALCTKDKGVDIQAGGLLPTKWGGKGGEIVTTDAQGRFSFPAAPEEFHLVAAHDEGFAWVTNKEWAASGTVRLEPWARIDGTVKIGREAGAGKQISLLRLGNTSAAVQNIHFDYETYADARGRFVFERVPPTWMEVGYGVPVGDAVGSVTSRTTIHLQPGENRKMTLGGEGRPVVGRFVPPAGYQGSVYFGAGLRSLAPWRPDPPRPQNYDRMTRHQQQEWLRQWYKTPEAEAFYDAIWHDLNRRQYAFRIENDGRFRIEDVIPGKYKFTVYLEKEIAEQAVPDSVGTYSGTMEVPPMTQVYTDEPLSLGDLTLKMGQPSLHLGDTAPLFEAKTLDGKDLRLIDYRGKFVLLSFWEPAFHPELDRLKELYQSYGGTGPLRIIGLGGWGTLEEVRKLVAERQIEWPEIYLGPNSEEGIGGQYRLPGAPYVLLVDPQGRIVATWLRGEKLTEAVEKAIPKP